MFKRDVQSVKDLILRNLREQGLETPLQQKRLEWVILPRAQKSPILHGVMR